MTIAADKSQTTHDPVRRWTLIVLGLIVVLFLYSIIADRMTPYTSQATVQAFVVRMAPDVAGRVIEVSHRQSTSESRQCVVPHRRAALYDCA